MGNTAVYGTATLAATTNYQLITIEIVPNQCYLDSLAGAISSIAGCATVTWYISLDNKGDVPITDAVTETILTGKTTATKGGIKTVIDRQYGLPSNGSEGNLFVWAKLDAGTCNLDATLWVREE